MSAGDRVPRWFSCTASAIACRPGIRCRAELVVVSTPKSLRGVHTTHLDRVVSGTAPLVDAVPYRVSGLDVEIGLFTFSAGYVMGLYLDLLSDIAAVASAFLPPARALASTALIPPIRKGLDQLFVAANVSDARLEVGLAHTWHSPITGYYAVVHAPSHPAVSAWAQAVGC